MPTKLHRTEQLIRRKGAVRARDLERRGIPRVYLKRLADTGTIVRRGRGVYAFPDQQITEHHTLAEVARLVPAGVICLLSALAYHGLGTQLPHQVWLAIGGKARAPRRAPVQLRVVRMSGRALTSGIERHSIEGVPVRIFSAAKTAADCFKFRNKIGLDVAVEALRAYRQQRGDLDALWRYAQVCRVTRVIRPYLEALT